MNIKGIYSGPYEPAKDMGWLKPVGPDDFELYFFSDQGWKKVASSKGGGQGSGSNVQDITLDEDGNLVISKEDGEDIVFSMDNSGAISKPIEVELGGDSMGSYQTGQVIDAGTSIYDILQGMLAKSIPYQYKEPSLSGTQAEIAEVGEYIPKMVFSWIQNDAGPLTGWVIRQDAQEVAKGATPSITYMPPKTSMFTDGAKTYQVQVSWNEGPVKDDNLGNPSPGNIKAGSKTYRKVFNGYRRLFAGSYPQKKEFLSNEEVRAMGNSWLASEKQPGSSADFSFQDGTMCVAVAVPKGYYENTKIIHKSTGLDLTGSFVKTEIQVTGANGMQPATYYLYLLNSDAPMKADVYVITF